MKFPVRMALIIAALMLLLIGIATLSGCDFARLLAEADKVTEKNTRIRTSGAVRRRSVGKSSGNS